jgi:hypothetical protein
VWNLTLEILGMKMMRGTTTKGRTVLIVQHHATRKIEATHQILHEEVEVMVGMMEVVEGMEGMMAVIEDCHKHPSVITRHHKGTPCLQQTQYDTVPLGYMRLPSTTGAVCMNTYVCLCDST